MKWYHLTDWGDGLLADYLGEGDTYDDAEAHVEHSRGNGCSIWILPEPDLRALRDSINKELGE